MIGDQAYYMGRAAARQSLNLEADPQNCPFAPDSTQGRSWRRGWSDVRGEEYAPPAAPTIEDKAASLLARLEALPRRAGQLATGAYWSIDQDFELIQQCRIGTSWRLIAIGLNRTRSAVAGRVCLLREQGFDADMTGEPVARQADDVGRVA